MHVHGQANTLLDNVMPATLSANYYSCSMNRETTVKHMCSPLASQLSHGVRLAVRESTQCCLDDLVSKDA